MSRKPIIADVARLAGVSTATVDRVLNDRGGVNSEKAARVLSAARRLKLDRNLTRRYSRVLRIAVLIQSSANPFHEALREAFASVGRRLRRPQPAIPDPAYRAGGSARHRGGRCSTPAPATTVS